MELLALKSRLHKISKMSLFTFIGSRNKKLWHVLWSGQFGHLIHQHWSERMSEHAGLFSLLLGWSLWSVSSFSSYVFLIAINIEHLGSITFSEILKLKLIRNEFTRSCSFLAQLLVNDPCIVSFKLDGRWYIWERSCMVGMFLSCVNASNKSTPILHFHKEL